MNLAPTLRSCSVSHFPFGTSSDLAGRASFKIGFPLLPALSANPSSLDLMQQARQVEKKRNHVQNVTKLDRGSHRTTVLRFMLAIIRKPIALSQSNEGRI